MHKFNFKKRSLLNFYFGSKYYLKEDRKSKLTMTSIHIIPGVLALMCIFFIGLLVEGSTIPEDCHLDCPYGRLTVDGNKLCKCSPNPCDLFRDVLKDVASCENVAFLDEDEDVISKEKTQSDETVSKMAETTKVPTAAQSFAATQVERHRRSPRCRPVLRCGMRCSGGRCSYQCTTSIRCSFG
jgi:hypothetical protein